MKWQFKIVLCVLAGSAPAFTTPAQALQDRLDNVVKASHVIGMTVKNSPEEKLGIVYDLILDVESGRIVQVILSTGGFMGVGKTLTAVPPGALHHLAGHRVLHLDASKRKFNAAPKFGDAMWDEDSQSNQVTQAYGYYGEKPYFISSQDENWQTNRDGAITRSRPLHLTGTSGRIDAAPKNPAAFSWARLGYVQKASKLMGTPVMNLQNEKLGQVENFVLDLSAGRIVVVIISSGGFMGMEAELRAVPPTMLRFNREHVALQMDVTKARLASLPHFKAGEWPDFSMTDITMGVYRPFQVEPYFSTNALMVADQTRPNIQDGDQRTLTPLDQGNTQADVNLTARIRQELVASPALSITAKNVKIITVNGRVTLLGPVNSAGEKLAIGEIADRIARARNVTNQLAVPLTPGSNY